MVSEIKAAINSEQSNEFKMPLQKAEEISHYREKKAKIKY